MENKNVNILLFLSDYKATATSEKYSVEGRDGEEWIFEGTQTNEAPFKMLAKCAREKNYNIKSVTCITSYKVMTQPLEADNQYERFVSFVKKYLQDKQSNQPQFKQIPYDYCDKEGELIQHNYGNQLPQIIYENINDNFDDGDEVYIDYTGGLRDISFLMTSIIRFLDFKGITCGEIVYSNFFEHKIYDIHYIYNLYQIINGVTEFTSTGNANELIKVYDQTDDSNPSRELLEKLIAFSDALSICDIGSLDKIMHEINVSITKLESCEPNGDISLAMIKTLAPIIRKKMYVGEKVDYPMMIKWCADNNLIQQAATIYTDKMPEYYFKNTMVPQYVDLGNIQGKLGQSPEYEGFYTELFDRASEGLEIKTFRNSLKSITNVNYSKGEICRNILNQKSRETDVKILKAYNRLYDYICFHYNSSGKKVKKDISNIDKRFIIYKRVVYSPSDINSDIDGCVLKEASIHDNIENLWKELCGNNNNFLLHRFLYNNEEDYDSITAPPSKSSLKTYRKKMHAILNIKNGKVDTDPCDKELTYKIMAYYLAVKLIRNRINHAGEGNRDNDEIKTIEQLNQLNIGINFQDNIIAYKDIILGGINLI